MTFVVRIRGAQSDDKGGVMIELTVLDALEPPKLQHIEAC